jgi:hypothetical protein
MSDRQDVTKRIMPNKCDICGIGIGTSMLYFENTRRPYKHDQQRLYFYTYSGKRLRVCGECIEFLDRQENPEQFLDKLFKGKKIDEE